MAVEHKILQGSNRIVIVVEKENTKGMPLMIKIPKQRGTRFISKCLGFGSDRRMATIRSSRLDKRESTRMNDPLFTSIKTVHHLHTVRVNIDICVGVNSPLDSSLIKSTVPKKPTCRALINERLRLVILRKHSFYLGHCSATSYFEIPDLESRGLAKKLLPDTFALWSVYSRASGMHHLHDLIHPDLHHSFCNTSAKWHDGWRNPFRHHLLRNRSLST